MNGGNLGQDETAAATVEAPAKINLFLLVGGRRHDGYHPVCSLMDKVTLFDHINVRRTGRPGVRLLGSGVPAPRNTVFRAAAALEEETGVTLDVEVVLEKRIPEAAGLAGGSSDAAAVLGLLNRMYSLKLSTGALARLAQGIGVDVPFFLEKGPMLAEGTGELLSGAGSLPEYHAVIVKPETGLSTAEVYAIYDAVAPDLAESFPGRRRDMLARLAVPPQSVSELARLMQNDLEAPAGVLYPGLSRIKEDMLESGAAGALMSGSGTSVFGLFAGKDAAEAALAKLHESYADVWLASPFQAKGE